MESMFCFENEILYNNVLEKLLNVISYQSSYCILFSNALIFMLKHFFRILWETVCDSYLSSFILSRVNRTEITLIWFKNVHS